MLTSASLSEAIEAFLLSRTVGGCTARTVQLYWEALGKFRRASGESLRECTTLTVQKYLTDLRARVNGTTVHLHFSKLRAFFSWCVESGLLAESPLRGVSMKAPKTLPRVPEDEAVRKLLQACPDTFEGRRNRALVALLADSGLRISEVLRLRIEDVNFAARTVNVRAGKGQKDGVGFFGAETTQHLRAWLSKRRDAHAEDYLFIDRRGRSLTRSHGVHILHKLSVRAGLPRKVGIVCRVVFLHLAESPLKKTILESSRPYTLQHHIPKTVACLLGAWHRRRSFGELLDIKLPPVILVLALILFFGDTIIQVAINSLALPPG